MPVHKLRENCKDPVLNSDFSDWGIHIIENLYSNKNSERYRLKPDKKLWKKCKAHVKDYQRAKLGDNTVILTHPLYFHITHRRFLENETIKKEADDYFDNLMGFLRRRDELTNLVAIDSIHHYAAATSLLLKQGKIDRVLFSDAHSGYVINERELSRYAHDNIYFAGAYNGRCFLTSMGQMVKTKEKNGHTNSYYAIKDLVMNHPKYSKSLKPEIVYGLADSRVLGLEDALSSISHT